MEPELHYREHVSLLGKVKCSLLEVDRRFRGAYCIHHQGDDRHSWSAYLWNVCLLQGDNTKADIFILAVTRAWNLTSLSCSQDRSAYSILSQFNPVYIHSHPTFLMSSILFSYLHQSSFRLSSLSCHTQILFSISHHPHTCCMSHMSFLVWSHWYLLEITFI
jgi:hypothetical protein